MTLTHRGTLFILLNIVQQDSLFISSVSKLINQLSFFATCKSSLYTECISLNDSILKLLCNHISLKVNICQISIFTSIIFTETLDPFFFNFIHLHKSLISSLFARL